MSMSEIIITKLYGHTFIEAREPMIILLFSSTLSLMGSVTYRYIIHYSGFYYLSIKTGLSLILSILISGIMTKIYGITGAALASVIVELLSLTILNYFFKKQAVLKMHWHSIRGR